MRRTTMAALWAALVLGGCGKKAEEKGGAGGGTSGNTAPTDPDVAAGKALGVEIGKAYVALVTELGRLVEGKPDPATAKGQVEALRDRYITTFVEMGKRRAALSPKGKSVVENAKEPYDIEANGLMGPVYTAMREYGSPGGPEGGKALSDLLKTFAQIAVYADLDALKRMKPKEAERLGVK